MGDTEFTCEAPHPIRLTVSIGVGCSPLHAATPEALLQGTPTLIVPGQTLTDFTATDYPWIVAADRNGVVRWIERAPDNALASDGDVNRIVNLILANWPPRGH